MMRLHRTVIIQLTIVLTVSIVAGTIMALQYMQLPAKYLGVGRYRVSVEFPLAGGLYGTANVTYRGTEVGKVERVELDNAGVRAVLTLKSDVHIPSDVDANVHSRSAIGEQYIDLVPRNPAARALREGDVIPADHTTIPPDIGVLMDTVQKGLAAVPNQNLATVVDESFNGLNDKGPDLTRILEASSALSGGARANLPQITDLIEKSGPVLQSQASTRGDIAAWAAHLADLTAQLRSNNGAFGNLVDTAGSAADQATGLLRRLDLTMPVLLGNLVNIENIAITYNANLEQLLVLLPQGVAVLDATLVPNLKGDPLYKGLFLDFNLNLNLPGVCTTGYLPSDQRRSPVFEDHPDRPVEDLYCRVPQNSPNNVRGMRNIPCAHNPAKKAPTAAMCESDKSYVPLNDGTPWIGGPNVPSGGDPNGPTGVAPASANSGRTGVGAIGPPMGVAAYDPASGTYLGPDGRTYVQTNLAKRPSEDSTWRQLVLPATH